MGDIMFDGIGFMKIIVENGTDRYDVLAGVLEGYRPDTRGKSKLIMMPPGIFRMVGGALGQVMLYGRLISIMSQEM